MIGAIIGDIVGSKYEFDNIKTKKFNLFSAGASFTDDTVMTVAIFEALKKCKGNYSKLRKYTIKYMQEYAKLYPNESYGNMFKIWIQSKNPKPYNSLGNGSAMRVSAVPYFAQSLEEVKELSLMVTDVTHNHPEGIKGAEATAVCIFKALHGETKEEIKQYVIENYYNKIQSFTYDDLVKNYKFNEICEDTVPQAIFCFLISTDFEDAIKTGVSIGGDSDTLCAITGAIAGAFYGIPESIKKRTDFFVDKKILTQMQDFEKRFEIKYIN